MSDLARLRQNIQLEETRYGAGVSEYTLQKVGGAINFINDRQVMQFHFGIAIATVNLNTPTYSFLSTPFTNFGGPETFPYDSEIVGVSVYHKTPGSSGTSEIDIEWAAANSGTFASIFSTTPKVASTAGGEDYFDTFANSTTPTGCTLPVLSKTNFDAGDKLRCTIESVMAGNPNGFLVTIYFKPR